MQSDTRNKKKEEQMNYNVEWQVKMYSHCHSLSDHWARMNIERTREVKSTRWTNEWQVTGEIFFLFFSMILLHRPQSYESIDETTILQLEWTGREKCSCSGAKEEKIWSNRRSTKITDQLIMMNRGSDIFLVCITFVTSDRVFFLCVYILKRGSGWMIITLTLVKTARVG